MKNPSHRLERCPANELVNTGAPPSAESVLSSIFVKHFGFGNLGLYGTRTQTVLLLDFEGNLRYMACDYCHASNSWSSNEFHIKFPCTKR